MLRTSPSSSPATSGSPATAGKLPTGERPLVLVVDPDRSARAVLEVALARDGFDVWSVESAAQGLGVLGRGRTPDVIVLESDLGGGDGFSFCAELRGNPKTAKVPVVLLARPEDKNVANLAEVVGVDESIQKPAFARDVAAMVRFELVRHRSPTGPLRFHGRVLPAEHLLRALLTSTRAGTLTLADGAASLVFRDGAIVKATFGDRWGIDAIVRALALTFGEYTVSLAPVSISTGFHCSLRDFVALALPRLSKWSLLVRRSLPLDAVLAVDFQRLAQALPQMPDDVNRIVQLFDGRRRVQQVLFDSPIDETLTLEVGTRLYLMGVIGPVAGSETTELIPRSAPRLFEPRSAEAEALMHQLFDGLAEIRADQVEPVPHDEDWAVPQSAAADLAVEDPAGGWTSTPLPEAHLGADLAPELANTLAAFNVPTVVEPKEARPAEQPVVEFAAGTQAEVEGGTLEDALRAATGDEQELAPLPLTELLEDPDPTPPSRRRAQDHRRDRIVTPVLTPAVQLEAVPLEAVAPEAVTPAPKPIPAVVLPDAAAAETAFFESGDSQPALTGFEETVPSAPAAQAAAAPSTSRSRVGLMVGLGVAAVAVVIGAEWLVNALPVTEVPVAALVPAPVAPTPTPEPVALAPLAAVEELVEAPPVDPQIDVTEPLADGLKAYQNGEYKKAISVLEQVVADDPKSIQGWLVLGQARYDAGDVKGAGLAAEQVLTLDPKNARVHVLKATIAADLNDRDGMRAELQKYLELEPEGVHAEEAKALLKGR